ncbi:MAG: hypothetical protein HZB95_03755 [Nitrosomonadales bacterium]|nr:hypothetical protein [Nitrosomonadales bacterium]
MTKNKKVGASLGENRFEKYQVGKIRSTVGEIVAVLGVLRAQRVSFRNITHLATYVAAVISERRAGEGNKIFPSTLLRATRYRTQLDGYLASLKDSSHKRDVERLISNFELKELDRLREENKRLNSFIEKNIRDVSEEPPKFIQKNNSEGVVDKFGRAISLILEASSGQYIVDTNTAEIVNGWARSKKNRVIVPADISKLYLEWKKSFPTLGHGETEAS